MRKNTSSTLLTSCLLLIVGVITIGMVSGGMIDQNGTTPSANSTQNIAAAPEFDVYKIEPAAGGHENHIQLFEDEALSRMLDTPSEPREKTDQ